MIWPWCERADMLGFLIGDRYKLDDERFPNLVSIKICEIRFNLSGLCFELSN